MASLDILVNKFVTLCFLFLSVPVLIDLFSLVPVSPPLVVILTSFTKKMSANDPFEPETAQNWSDMFALNTITPFFGRTGLPISPHQRSTSRALRVHRASSTLAA